MCVCVHAGVALECVYVYMPASFVFFGVENFNF